MLTDIITLLQTHHFKGAGKYTEIAKGENELGNNRRKLKRWLLRKRL